MIRNHIQKYGSETKSILIVSGEASGDLHGAQVVLEILKQDPTISIYGMGGEEMERAGVRLIARSSNIAVTGFFEVFSKIKKIREIFQILLRSIRAQPPDVAILIDCPDFNLRLAKKLHQKNIPILYYIGPQVWAWRRYRVWFIKKWILKMLVAFPFEVPFYRALGMDVEFVGHPLLDYLKPRHSSVKQRFQLDPSRWTIALMPGSRENEIKYLLKPLLNAAKKILNEVHQIQFLLPLASTLDEKEIGAFVESTNLPIKIVKGETPDALLASDIVICCSGTATLETAILGKPMVVILKMNRLTYFLGSLLYGGNIQFFSLPNLIAARKIVPELIQSDMTADRIANEVLRYLNDSTYLRKTSQDLLRIRDMLGNPGAAERVARHVFEVISRESSGQNHAMKILTKESYGRRALWVQRIFSPVLCVGAFIYGCVIKIRRYLYWTKWFKTKSVPVKVISIGNLTVGGTGKTPLTICLAQELQKRGKRVAILSRGYQRQRNSNWDCVSDGKSILLSARQSGDEPRLMAEKLKSVPVYVGADRYHVACEVLKRHSIDLFLLDDGFQHLKLERDFDFLTLDVTSLRRQPRLLPWGRFREPVTHIKRCNCLVLTRTDHIDVLELEKIKRRLMVIHPNVPMVEANYHPRYLEHMISKQRIPLEDLSGKKVFAFAGIGNPDSFKRVIQHLKGHLVGFKTYLDHFYYSSRHIRELLEKAREKKADFILTTEKDAVRIPLESPLSQEIPLYSLVVHLEITKGKKTFTDILDVL